MAILDIRNLSLDFGATRILKGIDLAIHEGEIVALVGESGSGKSLTALSVLGLQPDDARLQGIIRLDGQSVLNAPDAIMKRLRGRKIGMVFQEPLSALNPVMTIGDQVAETVRIHTRCSRKAGLAAARKALDEVDLPAPRFSLKLYPHQLSGGQRQRVAIAMAAILKPRLLIADEATAALDPVNQARVMDLLCDIARKQKTGLLLILHDLALAYERADRVVLLRQGRIEENADRKALKTGLKSDYGQRLLRDAQHTPAPRPPIAPDAPVVAEAVGVTRTYGAPPSLFNRKPPVRAVDDFSLSIRRGESVGLIGESGCGKSTLLRALIGLEPVQSGRMLLGEQDWAKVDSTQVKAMRRRVQPVFQDPGSSLDPRWQAGRILSEPLHLVHPALSPEKSRARIETVMEQVGLNPALQHRYPHQFSGGQKQRLALARALITEPDLIVLDEAVSALDVSIRAQILDLLTDLSRRLGIAYLFVSHDLEVVRRLTDRVLVMEAGRIVEQGATETVLASPQHPATQRLVAATPRLLPNTEPNP